MKQSHGLSLLLCISVGVILLTGSEAAALSRGLASKVRLMQHNGYIERLSRAEQAYKTGDYKACVQEAQLALQHARSDEQALPVRKLLAAAHTKLGNRASASPHLKWLAEHGPSK